MPDYYLFNPHDSLDIDKITINDNTIFQKDTTNILVKLDHEITTGFHQITLYDSQGNIFIQDSVLIDHIKQKWITTFPPIDNGKYWVDGQSIYLD